MRVLSTLCVLFISLNAYSQRFSSLKDGFLSQHWRHKMYYNPAATGSDNKKVISVNGSFYGSLSEIDRTANYYTGLVTYQQPFKANSRSSFGFLAKYLRQEGFIYGDRFAGITSYSYALPVGDEKFLRFGAQAGVIKLDYNFPYWGSARYKIIDVAPIFSAGMFYNSKTFYGGVALKSINQPTFQSDRVGGGWVDYQEISEVNILAGKMIFADKTFQYQPSVLVISDFYVSIFQLNNTVYYKNKYSLGASLLMERISTLALNAGIKIAEKAELGVSYEIPTGAFVASQGLEFSSRFMF